MPAIAYLEDEADAAAIVHDALEQAGYQVTWFNKGLDCARAVERGDFDACLLDWMVPDMAGSDVMTHLQLKRKESMPPVIFLTGRDSEADLVHMLAAGADDYIVKPAPPAILLARLHAVLRRSGTATTEQIASWGTMSADFSRAEISMDGQVVNLGRHESALALLFLQNIGGLLSRERLIQMVFGLNEHVESRALDVHISSLRRKLSLRPEQGWRLASIYGLGYRLDRISST